MSEWKKGLIYKKKIIMIPQIYFEQYMHDLVTCIEQGLENCLEREVELEVKVSWKQFWEEIFRNIVLFSPDKNIRQFASLKLGMVDYSTLSLHDKAQRVGKREGKQVQSLPCRLKHVGDIIIISLTCFSHTVIITVCTFRRKNWIF